MTILPIQALVTKTAAFTGAQIDVSGITGDWTLKLQVANLTPAGTNARFTFKDSVNAFTASVTGPSHSLQGALTKSADVVLATRKYEYPSFRLGVTNAVLLLALDQIDSGGSATYSAWIEY